MAEGRSTNWIGTSAFDESIGSIRDDGFFRAVAEGTADGVFAVDDAEEVVFANPAVADALGCQPADLVGTPLSDLVSTDLGRYRRAVELLRRDDDRPAWEVVDLPLVDGDGRQCRAEVLLRDHDHEGRRLITAVVRSVTDQTDDEREVERYERIIETIDDGIYVLDGNFVIRDVNEAMASLVGYDREELVGSHASLLASDSLLAEATEMSAELLSGDRDAATLTGEIETKDGDAVPIETRFSLYSLDGGHGQVGVVRDITDRKQFEETLRALHDSTRGLLGVETDREACELVVDTATDVIDLSVAILYLFDREGNVLRPAAFSDDAMADPPTDVPADGGVVWESFVEGTSIEVSDPAAGAPVGNGTCVPVGDHGVFVAGRDSTAFDDDTRTLVELLAASAEAALSRVRREREVRERDEKLQRQNRRLRQLDRVNAIIREIDQALVGADTLDEIGDAVCDRLVASNRFAFAWIGKTEAASDELDPQAWAGDARGYLDDVSPAVDSPEEPSARAAATREPVVVSDVSVGFREEAWRKAALSRDYRSVIAVPLLHDDLMYGVLTVYATRPAAFDEMVQSVFDELGETIANAMGAVETKRALLTDSRVELEFRVQDADDPLCRLARDVGQRLEAVGVVPQSADETRVFFTAEGVDPDRLRSIAGETLTVESVRLVAERDGSSLFEVAIGGPTVGSALVDHGAAVQSIEAGADGELSVVVELPNDADVRAFVDLVRSRHPGADLVGRRDRERPKGTSEAFWSSFERRLTDRQLEVLRMAYHSGFFEWPRETTGEEVAESLGVSQPTVNRHLRACERKLFAMLLGER